MKLLISAVLFLAMTTFAHAQTSDDTALPTNGESAAPQAVDAPPVENPKEFNQDIDDFENKISKEVPKAGASSKEDAHKSESSDKARAEMNRVMQEDRDVGGGNGIAARKAARAKAAIGRKTGKKASATKATNKKSTGKKSSKKKSSGKKSSKKSAAKKKKSAGR